MQNLDDANRMLDAFTSCGAQSFFVTKTELEWPNHKKVKWGKSYPVAELRKKLPAMVRTAADRRPMSVPGKGTVMAGENLIIRPTGPGVAFVQLDDLNSDHLERVRPAVFIIHATSPGNYQGWIAVSGLPEGKEQFKEFMRRVRKAVGGNDKSASHATRVAGTENFKAEYAPQFPTVTIVETHPGRIMTSEELKALGLLAPPEPRVFLTDMNVARKYSAPPRVSHNRAWPSYEKSLAGAPPSRSGNGPDRSMADYNFCMVAISWGWSIEDTAAKLVEVSEKAQERVRGRDEGYPRITAENAAVAVERNRQKRSR